MAAFTSIMRTLHQEHKAYCMKYDSKTTEVLINLPSLKKRKWLEAKFGSSIPSFIDCGINGVRANNLAVMLATAAASARCHYSAKVIYLDAATYSHILMYSVLCHFRANTADQYERRYLGNYTPEKLSAQRHRLFSLLH